MKNFAKLLALAMSLLVALPSYSQPVEKTIKRKVAIGRFSNETPQSPDQIVFVVSVFRNPRSFLFSGVSTNIDFHSTI